MLHAMNFADSSHKARWIMSREQLVRELNAAAAASRGGLSVWAGACPAWGVGRCTREGGKPWRAGLFPCRTAPGESCGTARPSWRSVLPAGMTTVTRSRAWQVRGWGGANQLRSPVGLRPFGARCDAACVALLGPAVLCAPRKNAARTRRCTVLAVLLLLCWRLRCRRARVGGGGTAAAAVLRGRNLQVLPRHAATAADAGEGGQTGGSWGQAVVWTVQAFFFRKGHSTAPHPTLCRGGLACNHSCWC